MCVCSMAGDESHRVQTEVEHKCRWLSQDFHSNFSEKVGSYVALDVRPFFVTNLGYCAEPLLPKGSETLLL